MALAMQTQAVVQAATLTVNSLADPGNGTCDATECTLREAIAAAAPGDTIAFSVTGTIPLAGTQLTLDKQLTIAGPGSARLTVDGNYTSRVFHVIPGAVVAIMDLTISNGLVVNAFGGGIHNEGVSTLTRAIVSNNATQNTMGPYVGHGGGIYNRGTLTLNQTAVTANSIQSSGGGFGNFGAGIFNDVSGRLTLNQSTVSNNNSFGGFNNFGGGIYNWSGTLELTESTVSYNSANTTGSNGAGGGVVIDGQNGPASGRIVRSTVSYNRANAFGSTGGIGAVGTPATLDIINSTIAGNFGSNDGGGVIGTGGATVHVSYSTIAGNQAGNHGGGLLENGGAHVDVESTVIADNTAGTGGDCYIESPSLFASLGYNLIANTTGCNYPPAASDLLNMAALLGPLTDNGGNTYTYALLSGSPAIDAIPEGSNGCGTDITTDQRGVSRPQGVGCDVGAFEVEAGFTFGGFFPPVVNPPVLNGVKAGSAIPMKFSLHGDQGLSIFAPGYPRSVRVACDTSAPLNDIGDETTTPGESGLTYDASTDQYTYVWKTNRNWAGTCRQFILRLTDENDHLANFQFK
jgi:CSLREA domain-containing protein